MNDTDSIIALLQTQALDLTLAELEERQPTMARRTLQRRLSELVEQGKILAPATEREEIEALVIAELRRLHEGTLARYRLRPAEFFMRGSRGKEVQKCLFVVQHSIDSAPSRGMTSGVE